MKIYRNTFDKTTKIITSSTLLLFVIIVLIMAWQTQKDDTSQIIPWMLIMFICIVFISWGLHPISYTIDKDSIIIKSVFKKIVLQRALINEIRAIETNELSGSMRLFGSGGMFGYYGRFYNKKFGIHRMQVTNRQKMLLIKVDGKTYIISPEEREDFLSEFK